MSGMDNNAARVGAGGRGAAVGVGTAPATRHAFGMESYDSEVFMTDQLVQSERTHCMYQCVGDLT
jgi:hypothetical protein